MRGSLRVPGDKSIAHRALLLSTLARGPARIRGLPDGEDVAATAAACRALGARIGTGPDEVVVHPPERLREPDDVLDCGNSGTSIRLLLGAIAAHPLHAVLSGDASLRARPMRRVVEPLRAMGAAIDGRSGGDRAPLAVRGGGLHRVHHVLPVASAQVKSALLLAGLRCGTSVVEPRRSRDHTERMLLAMGARVEEADGTLFLEPTEGLDPVDVDVPGDLSAAAFPLVAATLVPGSELVLPGVGVNPTRTGVLEVLAAMGADIERRTRPSAGPEPVADLVVRAAPLVATEVTGELALRTLDELVVIAVAAAFARGTTRIRDAAELRVKESDRIARVAAGLRALGVEVEEHPDGLDVHGGRPRGPAVVDATGDHRIAMAFHVAGLALGEGVTLSGAEAVRSSWPAFFEDLRALSG